MKRETLRKARLDKGLTQQQVADYLGITLRSYQDIEYCKNLGSIHVWDALEDLFGVHQRKLRLIEGTNHDQEDNQSEY